MKEIAELIIAVFFALLITAAVAVVTELILSQVGKKLPPLKTAYRHMRLRLFLFLVVGLTWLGLYLTWLSASVMWHTITHLFLIVTVALFGWLLVGIVAGFFKHSIEKFSGGDVYERKRLTQLQILRRLSTALIIVVTAATIIFSFPPLRSVGVSLFASAGLLSVIAGLAAQSTLTNLIAGLQLSFSDALRVGDTVVIEGDYGTVVEITLTYIVVDLLDDRKLILPCTFFTSQPFEQWTRHSGKIMTSIYLDCNWEVPIKKLRAKFEQLLAESPEYDGRYSNCGVVDSSNGYVRIKCVMSCGSVDDIWKFSRRIHEDLIEWLQSNHKEALPTTRIQIEDSKN